MKMLRTEIPQSHPQTASVHLQLMTTDLQIQPPTDRIQVKVTLRLTVSQSVSLCVESHLGLMTRDLLLFDSYGLVFVGRPLWREDRSVFCQSHNRLTEFSRWVSPCRLGAYWFITDETCLPRRCIAITAFFFLFHYSGFQPSCHNIHTTYWEILFQNRNREDVHLKQFVQTCFVPLISNLNAVVCCTLRKLFNRYKFGKKNQILPNPDNFLTIVPDALLSKNIKIRIYKTYNFACGSVWVWNLVSDIKGGT
jgi:hypothetical protein